MPLDLYALLHEVPLVFFDVETTGLRPNDGDRICELALLRCTGSTEVAFDTLVNPERPLSASAFAINQISAELLTGAPTFNDIADQVLALLDGSLLIAHNASFDLQFLNSELSLLGREPVNVPVLDTLAVARRLLQRGSYSLGALAESFGVQRPSHRALDDVRALRQVFAQLAGLLRAQGVETPAALLRYQRGLLPEDPEPEPPALIAGAMRDRRRLRLRYAGSSEPAPTEREVEPIELTVERGMLCLRAFCYLRNDVRTFIVARILQADLV